MWQTIQQFFLNPPLRTDIAASLLLLPAIWLLRELAVRLYFRRHPDLDIEGKRRVLVGSRNVGLLLFIFGLFAVWAAQIQTFALSMVALAAATVLATKELIMCLLGSLLRFTTRQYSVGDYITVNQMRGRVVDINLFNTLMMQIGPHDLIGQLSGKTISFPNSLLLSAPVSRDNTLGAFVVHTLDIPVPIHLDSDRIIPVLEDVLHRACDPYIAQMTEYFEAVQVQTMFITPAAVPRVSRVPHDDKVYHIVVRFASPLPKRLEIQQAVLDAYIRVQYRLLNPGQTA
ncbi:mechanosensitive ion channel domain-containing protein [Neisseria leonii]|uniref:Mechanosensitive ion channel domain-containing protein n=1 Tax=Neisseria leonii TaxID=2995413 RepID=A0A9X4E1I3_9NEIS|nr:mechanosensitive ion channel domain-containing protein [Neisseria sp. 51.81]MDD9327831.1 mechanosensitive ion channel family protein [Neisseria sp. 51.81]